MKIAEKIDLLKEIGARRQKENRLNFFNLDKYHPGYETEYVSPATKSSHNENSEIVVVLQDWSSDEALRQDFCKETAELGYTPDSRWHTFSNLKELLKTTFNRNLEDIFTTNLFPLIKSGSTSAYIPQADLDWAFDEYCWPQIEIVEPRLIICLGRRVYWTFLKKLSDKREIIGPGDYFMHQDYNIYYQIHTGGQGFNRRRKDQVFKDWEKMKQ